MSRPDAEVEGPYRCRITSIMALTTITASIFVIIITIVITFFYDFRYCHEFLRLNQIPANCRLESKPA